MTQLERELLSRRRAETELLTLGQTEELKNEIRQSPLPKRQLWENYDERIAIMTECHELTAEDVVAAWESTLKIELNRPKKRKETDANGTWRKDSA